MDEKIIKNEEREETKNVEEIEQTEGKEKVENVEIENVEKIEIVEKNKNDEENKESKKIEKVKEVEKVQKTCKEQFDEILEKIKKMSEAIELHDNVKEAVSKEEVDYNYLKYIENSLEDKLFCDAKIKGILPKVLLEVVCPDLKNIENFDVSKLEIEDIGLHFEEQENYIDKICVYDGKLISVFGISELQPEKVIKYESRKFTRVDMIEAVQAQYQEGQTVQLYQYDEYYIGIESERIKVFSERKITALVKIEETVFDKIKTKLFNFFKKKKRCYPKLELVYDSNPNRIKDIEHTSKFDAKSRMKILLNKEREVARNTAM